jgi:hypothetical protein
VGYTFLCDVCTEEYNHAPAFMGEFRESWIKTSDHWLAEHPGVTPGATFTLCEGCCGDILTL